MFVGRKKELARLEECWKNDFQKLVAVYGRRRIGKTILLEEFIKDKEGISFTAFRGNKDLLFKSLKYDQQFLCPFGARVCILRFQ